MVQESEDPIPPEEWEVIVRNVPIVSVDLLVMVNGGIVLGKRTNEPAKGEYFVPGGTVFKHEALEEAVHRVARQELGTDVHIDRRLGVYEHFYETADIPNVDGKHYVAIAHVVSPIENELHSDEQHAELKIFTTPKSGLDVHPYVERYLDALDEFD